MQISVCCFALESSATNVLDASNILDDVGMLFLGCPLLWVYKRLLTAQQKGCYDDSCLYDSHSF